MVSTTVSHSTLPIVPVLSPVSAKGDVPLEPIFSLEGRTVAIRLVNGDIIEGRVYVTMGGQTSINVVHFLGSGQIGLGGTLVEACQAFNNAMVTALKPLLSSSASYRGCGMRRIAPGTPSVEEFNVTGAGAGSVTGDPLPKQTCGIISKRTDFAGPRMRGRFFVPFPGESDNDSDTTPSTTYMTRLTTLASALILGFNAGIGPDATTFDLVIYHRVGGSTNAVTAMLTREKWATQRSRGDYGRPNASPI